MDSRISQQTRQNAAQQFRQWALARNVPLEQIEHMVTAMLSGRYDPNILQAMPSAQNGNRTLQRSSIFVDPSPAVNFQTPFGGVQLPQIPHMSPIVPVMYPPPANMVPNMFPTTNLQTNSQPPLSESTRTIFPGGEALQQNTSYSGQQGNTTFQYISSSTSMTFEPDGHLPGSQLPSMAIQQMQQPVMPMMSPSAAQHQPAYIPQTTIYQPPIPQSAFSQPTMPQPTLLQPQQNVESYIQPQPDQTHIAPNFPTPIMEVPAKPEPVFNPAAANQAPQNPRLAGRLKQKLDEATYFSEIPGMPDGIAQR